MTGHRITFTHDTREAAVLSSTSSTAKPIRGLSFWILVFILAFSPLPLASVNPIWSALYGLLVGGGLIAYVLEHWRSRRTIPVPPALLWLAAVLVGLVAAWGYLQAMPGLLPALQHPFWAETAALLSLPEMPGYLSLAPEQSVQVATRFLIYLGFGLLVFWHSRWERNALLLLKIFVGLQGAYALYGLTVYYAGWETILWFEKTAYQGVLTSTFVNRNSYATYAGLGVLAALALTLRFVRQTVDSEQSQRSKLRELIEAVTSRGWLLPLILILCFLVILLTQSRMGLIATMVGAATLLGVWVSRLKPGQARTLGGILLVVLLSLLALNLVLSGGLTADRFNRLFEQGDGRFQVYPLIQEAILARPWTGHGLGSFATAFAAYRDASVTAFFDRGHCDYLELIMDVGWPAAMAMFAAFALLLLAAWRAGRKDGHAELALLSMAATVQIAVHSTVDFSMQIPAVVFAYLTVALVGLGKRHKRGLTSRPRSLPASERRSIFTQAPGSLAH